MAVITPAEARRDGWALLAVVLSVAVFIGVLSAMAPDAVVGLAMAPAVVTVLILALYRSVRRHEDFEFLRPVFCWGVAERFVMVGAQLGIGYWFYRGQIDFIGYQSMAVEIVKEIIGGGFHPFDPAWIQARFVVFSGFATALFVALIVFLVGPHIASLFVVTVPISAAAAYLFVRAFETACAVRASRRFLAVALFLFPSISFWSIFLGKDVWVFFFLALATCSFARVLERPRWRHVAGLGVGLIVIFVLRPHIGVTISAAVTVALVLRPIRLHGAAFYLRPVYRVGVLLVLATAFVFLSGGVLANVGVKVLTLEALAERAWEAQVGFATTEGGSSLPVVLSSRDPLAVALFVPFGVTTLLFRPFLWEAHNAVALIAGVENLFLLGLVLWRWRSFATAVAAARRQPFVLFVLVGFTMMAITLSFDWNLGTTQRHRTMVLPYLLMLLAVRSPTHSPGQEISER